MSRDPAWIVYVLSDLHQFAIDNLHTEVALHIASAVRHVKPYVSENPPASGDHAEIQVAKDVIDSLAEFSRAKGMEEARLHLLAARRKILEHNGPDGEMPSVIAFPSLPR